MNQQSKYHRLHFLSASLAKLLEKSPPTYYDETPLATWVEAVDKISGELAKELGGSKALSAALDTMAALQTRADEAQEFCEQQGLQPGEYTWFTVLNYAKTAGLRIQHAEEIAAKARGDATAERDIVMELEAEVTRLKDELNRQPRRFKAVG